MGSEPQGTDQESSKEMGNQTRGFIEISIE